MGEGGEDRDELRGDVGAAAGVPAPPGEGIRVMCPKFGHPAQSLGPFTCQLKMSIFAREK